MKLYNQLVPTVEYERSGNMIKPIGWVKIILYVNKLLKYFTENQILLEKIDTSTKNKVCSKFIHSSCMRNHFGQKWYLSSCQKEFVSNSGSTSVAFIIRAATTALHIYKNKTIATLILLPSMIQP
jgi:hypothetical protein